MIEIKNERDIVKFIAFLSGRARADFRVASELGAILLERVREFAEQNQLNIEVITPSGEVILAYTAGGAVIGGAAGYLVGGLPGALVGTVTGAALGYSVAHLRFTWEESGDALVIKSHS